MFEPFHRWLNQANSNTAQEQPLVPPQFSHL